MIDTVPLARRFLFLVCCSLLFCSLFAVGLTTAAEGELGGLMGQRFLTFNTIVRARQIVEPVVLAAIAMENLLAVGEDVEEVIA